MYPEGHDILDVILVFDDFDRVGQKGDRDNPCDGHPCEQDMVAHLSFAVLRFVEVIGYAGSLGRPTRTGCQMPLGGIYGRRTELRLGSANAEGTITEGTNCV